jgi:hypothetical protein
LWDSESQITRPIVLLPQIEQMATLAIENQAAMAKAGELHPR